MSLRAAVLGVALATNAAASDLDPVCHEYYETIQSPGLTYEDIGRIAEAMYHKQCWPAMQGLFTAAQSSQSSARSPTGLPSCEYLAEQLVDTSDNVRKLFEVRPMTQEDCGRLPKYCTNTPDLNDCDREVWPSVMGMPLSQCDLLVGNPAQLAKQSPELGLRPVNCRGKILYSDGTKAGFYLYMEQYSDGDRGVWGRDIYGWRW